MATILEKLQEQYPNAEGINDARNIAEALACVNGNGGRGANAISDQLPSVEEAEPANEES